MPLFFPPIGCHTVPQQSSRVEQLESHCKPVGPLSATSWWQTWTLGLTSCWGSSECTLKFPFGWLAEVAEGSGRSWGHLEDKPSSQDAAAVCSLVGTDIMLHCTPGSLDTPPTPLEFYKSLKQWVNSLWDDIKNSLCAFLSSDSEVWQGHWQLSVGSTCKVACGANIFILSLCKWNMIKAT